MSTVTTGPTASPKAAAGFAARMAHFPGSETVWAIERIRFIVDTDYYDDATARQLVCDVLAGLDLAVQRRRSAA